ncbi:RNA-directed DNA polymerase, eukaryota [Tanacetum coccineum]|uniref:RNA-directed DNA polymerase, eukaryota n=1 Tax=Tanacetum coccineum TaxID=301880 RepID=A0ABQ4WVL0_9ASTR
MDLLAEEIKTLSIVGFHIVIASYLLPGVNSWFCTLLNAYNDFVSDERVVWVDIEGIPLHVWSRETFAKIGNKWGEALDIEDNFGSSFARKRLCILTKQPESILEKFKESFILSERRIKAWRKILMEGWRRILMSSQMMKRNVDWCFRDNFQWIMWMNVMLMSWSQKLFEDYESIRSNSSTVLISFRIERFRRVAWDNVLASKLNGGLVSQAVPSLVVQFPRLFAPNWIREIVGGYKIRSFPFGSQLLAGRLRRLELSVYSSGDDLSSIMKLGCPAQSLRKDIGLKGSVVLSGGLKKLMVRLQWSPSGLLLSSGSRDNKIHFFDIRYARADPLTSIQVHNKRVFKAVFHPTCPVMISISVDKRIGYHNIIGEEDGQE